VREDVNCSQIISEDLTPASSLTPLRGSHRPSLVEYLDDREIQVGSRDFRLEVAKGLKAAAAARIPAFLSLQRSGMNTLPKSHLIPCFLRLYI
jgi:hypothetical protein